MTAPICRRCQTPMQPGIAIDQTYTGGERDFPSDLAPVTFSAGGPGRVIDCWKCPDCGRSMTKGTQDE